MLPLSNGGKMYCRNCGNELPENSAFCNKCGTKQDTATNTNTQSNIQKLKAYKKLKKCTCLECGYSGLMGIVRHKNSFEKRFLIPLIPVFIVSFITYAIKLPFWGSLIAVAVTWLVMDTVLGNDKKVLYCPNCGKEIIEQ